MKIKFCLQAFFYLFLLLKAALVPDDSRKAEKEAEGWLLGICNVVSVGDLQPKMCNQL